MHPLTPPSAPPRPGPDRSLGEELTVSLLTSVGLLGGSLAAYVTYLLLPGPGSIVGTTALFVGLLTAIAIPLFVAWIGRLVVTRLGTLVVTSLERRDPHHSSDVGRLDDRSDPDRPARRADRDRGTRTDRRRRSSANRDRFDRSNLDRSGGADQHRGPGRRRLEGAAQGNLKGPLR